MAETTYLDFDLLVERSEAGYRARVLNSPAGQAATEFTLPFSGQELEIFLLQVGRPQRGTRRDVRRQGQPEPQMEAARVFGGQLFEAVFKDEVRTGLLRTVTADTYVICANGKYDNPDLATLKWIVEAAREQGRTIDIRVTSATDSTRQLVAERDPDDYGYRLTDMEPGEHVMILDLTALQESE